MIQLHSFTPMWPISYTVTTIPLSVCYGALNLSVCVDASNFVPYACDQAVTGGEYEGPEVPHRRPPFPVVAWQQNGRTVLRGLSHLYFLSLGWSKCLLYVLSFYYCPGSLIGMPLVSSQVPSFVPQEKKSARCCRFGSLSDSGFIAPNMAFHRPYKARTDISLANKCVT